MEKCWHEKSEQKVTNKNKIVSFVHIHIDGITEYGLAWPERLGWYTKSDTHQHDILRHFNYLLNNIRIMSIWMHEGIDPGRT